MKIWIYVICFLPAIFLDVLRKEYVSFYTIVRSLFPSMSIDDTALICGLLGAAVSVLLYAPAFFTSKKWVAHLERKGESRPKINLARIPRIIGIVLGVIIVSTAIIVLFQIKAVWFINAFNIFCDTVVIGGFLLLLASYAIRQKWSQVSTALRLSGSGLFVLGLTLFYLFTKLQAM